MTLHVDLDLTRECALRLKADGGRRTVFKVLGVDGDDPETARLRSEIRHWHWEAGWNEAEGETPLILTLGVLDEGGFHTYFNRHEVSGGGAVVPFVAYLKDFVAAGHSHACGAPVEAMFRRLYLNMGDYEMAVKEGLEHRKAVSSFRDFFQSDVHQTLAEAQERMMRNVLNTSPLFAPLSSPDTFVLVTADDFAASIDEAPSPSRYRRALNFLRSYLTRKKES